MISTVITVVDEFTYLDKCLASVAKFSDRLIIISLKPSEILDAIAQKYSAEIITHSLVDYVEKVRNFGITQVSSGWVLVLDPDEEISPTLGQKLIELTHQANFVAVNIPRQNYIFGKWISHSNFWPDRQIRFFKTGSVFWPEVVHSYPEVTGHILDLPPQANLALIHHAYSSVDQFIFRSNRYSSAQAEVTNTRHLVTFMVWQPIRDVLSRYFKHAGFLDGWHGLFLSYLMVIYHLSVWVKLWQKKQNIS